MQISGGRPVHGSTIDQPVALTALEMFKAVPLVLVILVEVPNQASRVPTSSAILSHGEVPHPLGNKWQLCRRSHHGPRSQERTKSIKL